MRATLAALCTLLCFSASAYAQQNPENTFRKATTSYERGAYKRVITLLRPLLYPKNRLSARKMQLQAHKMLGVSYVFEKNHLAAEQSFIAILAQVPKFRLDPLVDPPAAVKVFEAVRIRSNDMLRKIEEAQRAEERRQRDEQKERERELKELRQAAKRGSQVLERTIERHPYWLNFIPFGVGQFQNGHRVKGAIVLSAQIATAVASLGMALGYRIRFPDGRYSPEEKSTVDTLRTGQMLSGAVFWALVVYGVLDAINYHQPEHVREHQHKVSRRFSIAPAGINGMGLTITF
ncbi:MAG: hypothetical protein JRH20_15615 [Deltaproteobacteria bacterium]|nr:hypothetical protein [Deltaproteobacteria bacterium]